MPIAVAVVLHAGSVLVGRRLNPPLAGLAEFPGGKVHAGESPEEAAVREAREEAGIEVRVERLLASGPADYPHGRLDLRFYLCRPGFAAKTPPAPPAPQRSLQAAVGTSGAPSPGGAPTPHPPFRWIPLEELDHLDFPLANAAALSALRTVGSG